MTDHPNMTSVVCYGCKATHQIELKSNLLERFIFLFEPDDYFIILMYSEVVPDWFCDQSFLLKQTDGDLIISDCFMVVPNLFHDKTVLTTRLTVI